MCRNYALLLCVSLAMTLGACGLKETSMQSQDKQVSDADGDPVYRKNPHPKQAYQIRMTIEGAPGPFAAVSGTAFYQMNNHLQCTPVEPVAGVWSKSKGDGIPLNFKKINENEYVSIVFFDGMIDADYYGKGICRFELNGVGITLKATESKEDTRFQPGLFKSEIGDGRSKVTYFWSGGYPRDNLDGFPDQGEPDPARFKEDLRNDLFKVTLLLRKEEL